MPRSDIVRTGRPGLMVAPQMNHSSRTQPKVFQKISHVPQINLSGAVRHLTYHAWPTKHHDLWKWNIGQLAERWKLFNGKKCLGVVYDEKSHHLGVVEDFCRSQFGMEWDLAFALPNDPVRGELVTWHRKLEFLSPEFAVQNEVVFNAHAKGVKYEEANTNVPWTALMYEANLDDWATVQEQLETHGVTGCLRLRGDNGGFRYAGSFYWYRLSEVKENRWRDIHPSSWGAEDWPSRHFALSASGCLFGDHETLQGPDSLNASFERWRNSPQFKRIRENASRSA